MTSSTFNPITYEVELMLLQDFILRNDQWAQLAADLFLVQQNKKHWEAQESTLLKQLKEMSEGLNSCAGAYTFSCTERKGSIAYDEIPFLKDVNLEPFRKPAVQVWKLAYVGEEIINMQKGA